MKLRVGICRPLQEGNKTTDSCFHFKQNVHINKCVVLLVKTKRVRKLFKVKFLH